MYFGIPMSFFLGLLNIVAIILAYFIAPPLKVRPLIIVILAALYFPMGLIFVEPWAQLALLLITVVALLYGYLTRNKPLMFLMFSLSVSGLASVAMSRYVGCIFLACPKF